MRQIQDYKTNRMIVLLFGIFLLPSAIWAGDLTRDQAVAKAENFILENGYTDAWHWRIKNKLDHESIEWTQDRGELIKQRHNSLERKAIGARKGRKGGQAGWSVAFEYTRDTGDSCRVVTMDTNGSNIRVEHVDGVLSRFKGFDIE